MYAEPMGSKTPTRSPQTALRLDGHAGTEQGEEVLHTPRHVPGALQPSDAHQCKDTVFAQYVSNCEHTGIVLQLKLHLHLQYGTPRTDMQSIIFCETLYVLHFIKHKQL